MERTVVEQKPSKIPKLIVNNLNDFKKNMMLIRQELSRGKIFINVLNAFDVLHALQ